MYDFSVAIVNGSRFFEGTYTSAVNLYQMISKRVRRVNWYQCIDPVDKRDHKSLGSSVFGLNFPIRYLQLGLNRIFVFPRELRKLKEDIVIFTDPTLFSAAKELRQVVVVKFTDLRPLTQFSDNPLTRFMFKYQIKHLERANHIIVTTGFTRTELMKYYSHPELISVIPESFNKCSSSILQLIQERVKRVMSDQPVNILYVAQDRKYKNIEFYAKLAKHFSNIGLERAISFTLVSRLRRATKISIKKLGMDNLKTYTALTDLDQIYEGSDILVYPSMYEGFGMPVIEAMSHGLPVIESKIEPLIEVAGGCAMLVRRFQIHDWTNAILELISNPASYEQYSLKSLERSDQFSNQQVQLKVDEFLDLVSTNIRSSESYQMNPGKA